MHFGGVAFEVRTLRSLHTQDWDTVYMWNHLLFRILHFWFGNPVNKMFNSAPLPYNNENTDSKSTSIAQIYLEFF